MFSHWNLLNGSFELSRHVLYVPCGVNKSLLGKFNGYQIVLPCFKNARTFSKIILILISGLLFVAAVGVSALPGSRTKVGRLLLILCHPIIHPSIDPYIHPSNHHKKRKNISHNLCHRLIPQ